MHPMVGPDPAWLSRVRGCFIVSIEARALVSGLQLIGLHLDRYLALKCQNFVCFY